MDEIILWTDILFFSSILLNAFTGIFIFIIDKLLGEEVKEIE